MLTRRQFTAFAGTAAAAVAAPVAAAAGVTSKTRRAEVSALRSFAEKTHPRGREAASDAVWRARWDQLEARAESLSDGAYFIGLRRALGWLGDGHTTALPFEFTGGVPKPLAGGPFGLNLPLKVGVFHDGAFVIAADAPNRAHLGKPVERVGGLTTAELIRAHATDWPGNKAWSHRWAAGVFESPALLHGLGAVSDPALAVPYGIGGSTVSIPPTRSAPKPMQMERVQSQQEHWAKAAGNGNYVKPLPDERAVYISIDDMDDVDGRTFEQLTRDAFAAIDASGYDRLIIDLRRNGGGNNFLGEALRKRLEASRFNRTGGIYVLISPKTFSAAQNFANRLERETFAIFVGEPTGGAPNHYGDAQPFVGEATGITSIVSTLPWFDSYPQDQRPWIMPDLPVPHSFDDWRSGRDPALNRALTHRPGKPVDFWSRQSVFYFRRDSQKTEWKPFWA